MEQTGTTLTDDDLRALVLRHWQVSDRPGAGALYDDDSVLEFPQSGERFRGRANIQGFREQYPTDVALEIGPRRRERRPLGRASIASPTPTAARRGTAS